MAACASDHRSGRSQESWYLCEPGAEGPDPAGSRRSCFQLVEAVAVRRLLRGHNIFFHPRSGPIAASLEAPRGPPRPAYALDLVETRRAPGADHVTGPGSRPTGRKPALGYLV